MVRVAAHASVDDHAVLAALADVADPEIPAVSIVDLGIVHAVSVDDAGITVELLPTFIGCPALDVMKEAVAERLGAFGRPVDVRISHAVPWTSDRISTAGRRALERSGFAPPPQGTAEQPSGPELIQLGTPVPCPHCGSRRTVLENLFGPTQCRTIHHCTACRQPFEAFKQV
jgi:ring-1,2-phenylacetyl-CoA epoxidase subunit PaaD